MLASSSPWLVSGLRTGADGSGRQRDRCHCVFLRVMLTSIRPPHVHTQAVLDAGVSPTFFQEDCVMSLSKDRMGDGALKLVLDVLVAIRELSVGSAIRWSSFARTPLISPPFDLTPSPSIGCQHHAQQVQPPPAPTGRLPVRGAPGREWLCGRVARPQGWLMSPSFPLPLPSLFPGPNVEKTLNQTSDWHEEKPHAPPSDGPRLP